MVTLWNGDMVTWLHVKKVKWCHGDMVKWWHGDMVARWHGDMITLWNGDIVTRLQDKKVTWCHGDMVIWWNGEIVTLQPPSPWFPPSFLLPLLSASYFSQVPPSTPLLFSLPPTSLLRQCLHDSFFSCCNIQHKYLNIGSKIASFLNKAAEKSGFSLRMART